jgi:hypothetical protein
VVLSREFRKRNKLGLEVRIIRVSRKQAQKLVELGGRTVALTSFELENKNGNPENETFRMYDP